MVGVADGVGGWRSYGVDPGRFSRAVMKNCERLVNSGRFMPDKLEFLIAQCYEDVLNSKELILGIGYLVIREGTVIHRSVHQKHSFNTPFQLALRQSRIVPSLITEEFKSDDCGFPAVSRVAIRCWGLLVSN
ncbi:unnamed protein product [Trichobilharzia regenti]|nr:unnamed protein product [Trichobilharzia regenti]